MGIGGNLALAALEVDDAGDILVAAALLADGDLALIDVGGLLLQVLGQGFFELFLSDLIERSVPT